MALASLAVRLLSFTAAPSVLFWQPMLDARSHMLGPAELMRLWLAEDVDHDVAYRDYVAAERSQAERGDCPCGCGGHPAWCGY